jgi:hypothetical protein
MYKGKLIMLIVLSVLLAGVPVSRAEAPLGPDEFTSVDELALAIAGYFPKAKGQVTAVTGNQVTIDIGRKDGIVPNMVLSLWRPGKEILHPLTKAVIGRAEDEVGSIEVTAAAEASSTAVMKRQVLEPNVGDRARMSPRKISLAVVPLRSDRPEILEGLVERLGELGRFSVLDQSKVTAFLKERKDRDATLVREMGSAFALDAVVAVAILPSEGKQLVTARIFYADETQPLDTIVATLNLKTKREALGDVRPFFAPVKESASKTPALPVAARYFALADLDGDGTIEYIFTDTKRISIYHLESSEWKAVWAENVPSIDRDAKEIYLGIADINRNGRPEIFVTHMRSNRVSSFAVEFQDGGYRKIADIPGFVRVATVPGTGTILLGQEYTPEKFFSGKIKELSWSGTGYVEGMTITAPPGADLYSVLYANLGEARPLVVAFDREYHLAVYNGDTVLWKSEEEYRTEEMTVLKPLSTIDALGRGTDQFGYGPLIDKHRIVQIHGRMLAVDVDGNGSDEVLVPRNRRAEGLGEKESGEVQGLTWTGVRLDPSWSVKDLPGVVLDIQAAQSTAGGTQVCALIKIPGGLFSKDVLQLEWYDVK